MHLSKILDKNHQKIQRRDFIAKVTQGSTNLLIGSKMVKAESDKNTHFQTAGSEFSNEKGKQWCQERDLKYFFLMALLSYCKFY